MITVRWVNPNPPGAVTGIEVYRSDAPMDVGDLPAPLASLDSDATSYDDDTTVNGQSYYYRVAFLSSSEMALSGERVLADPSAVAAPISPPPTDATHLYAYDSTSRLLYTKEGDKVIDEWASTRKILAAVVAWEEKKDVWDTELVTVTSEDINSTGPEFRSGAEDGDQLTWKGVIELMLVPSMSDMAGLVTRVLGQHLLDKYRIGETAERAMGYWMAATAIRAGARNVIAFTNTSTWSAPDDEIINTNVLMTSHALARSLQFVLEFPELRRIMELTEVSVPIEGGGTLDHPTIDRLQSGADLNGDLIGYEFEGYIAGKTGDSTWGNQVLACGMPSGDVMFATTYHASTRMLRARDLIRLIMATENEHPHLRGSETSEDPHAVNVAARVLGEFPPADVGPESRAVSYDGVEGVATSYGAGEAVRFEGGGYIDVGTPPALGSGDFTAEVFLRGGPGGAGDMLQSIFGAWDTGSNNRAWLLRLNQQDIQFLYSEDGVGNTVLTAPVNFQYVLNGAPSHICAQRSGGSLTIFFNGQPGPVYDVSGVSFFDAPGASLVIGARNDGSGYEQNMSADLDEAILTVGVARYNATGFRPRHRPGRWG